MRFVVILFFTLLAYGDTYTFGIVPQQSPAKLIQSWQPIADYLSEKSGHTVVLKIEKSIPEFEKNLYEGAYDFAYMNPYHYVVANKKHGYLPYIRSQDMLQGILVAKDEKILETRPICQNLFLFPAPDALAATILAKYELSEKYGVDFEKECKYLYVNSHDSVYKGVARDIGDIGGGINRTFQNLKDQDTKSKLHIIYKTNLYPSHPIAFHPRVSNEIKEQFTTLLLNIPSSLLEPLSIQKFITTDNAEYESVHKLAHNMNKVNK